MPVTLVKCVIISGFIFVAYSTTVIFHFLRVFFCFKRCLWLQMTEHTFFSDVGDRSVILPALIKFELVLRIVIGKL